MASGALRQDITSEDNVHVGEDRSPWFDVFDADGNSVNMTGKSLRWRLILDGVTLLEKTTAGATLAVVDGRASKSEAKTATPTVGTKNRVQPVLLDTDTAGYDATALYEHDGWRLDAGATSPFVYGSWVFVR